MKKYNGNITQAASVLD
ncbi:MAG: hypothetical protein WDO15_02145 [Bacteroidota bacterium]